MDNEEISHQQSLVTDSFSTIERLESDMASITREFESLDTPQETDTELPALPHSHAAPLRDVRSEASETSPPSETQEESKEDSN